MTYPDSQPDVPLLSHPLQLEVLEFSTYALVIDARSPHEYEEDHLPTAVKIRGHAQG